MKLIDYNKHPLILTIKDFCTKHEIKFTFDYNGRDYFDPKNKCLILSPTKTDSLNYNLFIASHEYGHAYQYVHKINSHLDKDSIYIKCLMEGKKIRSTIKNRLVQTYLAHEYNASLIGLRLMNKLKYPIDIKTRKFINYHGNIQLVRYSMLFNNGIDLSDYNFKVPSTYLMNPDSQKFNNFVDELSRLFSQYIVHTRLGNP